MRAARSLVRLLVVLMFLVAGLGLAYYGSIFGFDVSARLHRDALVRDLAVGTPRARVQSLIARESGEVTAVHGQPADIAAFVGARYVLVQPHVARQCMDFYIVLIDYRGGKVQSLEPLANRQCGEPLKYLQ